MVEKNNYFSLIICLMASVFIVLKMVTDSNMFLLIFLLFVCIGMVLDKQSFRIEYLLFFISWIYVIKLNQDSFSLFACISIVYIGISLLSFFIHQTIVSLRVVLAFFLFFTYILTVSLLKGTSMITILGFLLNFLVLFFAIYSTQDRNHFKRYSLMYALGLITTCIVSSLSIVISPLKNYIESIYVVNTVIVNNSLYTRFSGLDLDPNYFGMQVLLAISCLLVLAFYNRTLGLKEMSLIILFSIFGILSLSKMFILSLLLFIILSLLLFLKNNSRKAFKWFVVVIVIGGVGMIFFFEKIYSAYWTRFFGLGRTTEAITTGRIESWKVYVNEIFNHSDLMLFGAGVGTKMLNGLMPHNMYISAFYYIGLVGISFVLFYFWNLFRGLQTHLNCEWKFKLLAVSNLPFYMTLFANNALDSFIMDFFLLHLLLVFLSMLYSNQSPEFDRGT